MQKSKVRRQKTEVRLLRRNVGVSKLFPSYFCLSPSARQRGGFTLIELLVVMAVIGFLLSITLVSIQNVRAKSRDATREEHIKTLHNALALHVTNASAYPVTAAEGVYLTGSDSVSTTLISSGSLSAIPRDPLNAEAFRYHYASPSGQTYVITYYLETSSIPGKAPGQQTVGP